MLPFLAGMARCRSSKVGRRPFFESTRRGITHLCRYTLHRVARILVTRDGVRHGLDVDLR